MTTRRPELKNNERRAVWETLLWRSRNGKLSHGELGAVAREFNIGRHVVETIWTMGKTSMQPRVAAVIKSRSDQRGRKKKDRTVYCTQIRAIPLRERTNQERLQLAASTSRRMIQNLIREGYVRHALHQTRPLLTPKHEIKRLKFCVSHVILFPNGICWFDAMYDVVHIDEKWFYIKKVGDKVYIVTDKDGKLCEEPPVQHVQSKNYTTKVMFLVAVARPRGEWDGKIGIWPVVAPYLTQRTSYRRAASVIEYKPVTIDRPKARNMLLEDVIPAIKAKRP